MSYRVIMMLSNVWPETTNVDLSSLKNPVSGSSHRCAGNRSLITCKGREFCVAMDIKGNCFSLRLLQKLLSRGV